MNDLTKKNDFEKKTISFIQDWFSDQPTVWVKTSGSTGKPKELEVDKNKMKNSANKTLNFLNIQPNDKALLALPIDFISGKMMLVRAIERNLKLIIAEPSLQPLKELNEQVHFSALTPLQVENSLEKIHFVQNLIIGGAAVSENLIRKIHLQLNGYENKVRIFETFGMTETLSHIALREVFPIRQDYFTPLEGVTISTDHRGCLTIAAPDLFSGEIYTNDRVEINEENGFKFLGRVDFVINSGGFKVFPEDIEQQINRQVDLELIITSIPDEKLGEKIILIIEDKSYSSEEKLEIKKKIQSLDFQNKIQKPKDILFVNKIPRTENDKVSRKEMKRWLLSEYLH